MAKIITMRLSHVNGTATFRGRGGAGDRAMNRIAGAFRGFARAALTWLAGSPPDPGLEDLIARGDDRLLDDAGLRRDVVTGRWRYFRERELDPMLGRRRPF
jgi:hypothetical protein